MESSAGASRGRSWPGPEEGTPSRANCAEGSRSSSATSRDSSNGSGGCGNASTSSRASCTGVRIWPAHSTPSPYQLDFYQLINSSHTHRLPGHLSGSFKGTHSPASGSACLPNMCSAARASLGKHHAHNCFCQQATLEAFTLPLGCHCHVGQTI